MATPALFNELRGFLTAIDGEKTAAAKKADAASDPGGYHGGSSHPTAKQTGDAANLHSSTEGARSSENESDVKATIPNNVNTTSGNTGTQDQVQLGQGVKAKETGQDVPTVKGDKEDPGSSHPATTEDGEKYGGYAGKPFTELYKTAGVLANDILASIATQVTHAPKTAAAPAQPAVAAPKVAAAAPAAPAPAPAAPAQQPVTAADIVKAAQAGYNLAETLNRASPEAIKAANARIAAEQMARDAVRAADLTTSFQNNYIATKQAQAKRAADESDSDTGSKSEPSESSESEGGGGGGGGSEPSSSEGGGGGGGGGEPGGGGGGGGGDPLAAMGGGGGGGGGDPGQAVQQLLMALMEMGITPDMLMQGAQGMPGGGAGGPPGGGDPMAAMGGGGDPMAAMGGGGDPMAAMAAMGGGGGGPPGAGGGPPGMEVAAAHRKQAAVKSGVLKLAAAAKKLHLDLVKAGSFKLQPAKTAQEAQLRSQIQNCVREILASK